MYSSPAVVKRVLYRGTLISSQLSLFVRTQLCFHLMSVPIQPRILIKGRAALPLSRWACLIFRPLGCGKKEATYKLERV